MIADIDLKQVAGCKDFHPSVLGIFKPSLYCYVFARKDGGGVAAHVMERVEKTHFHV